MVTVYYLKNDLARWLGHIMVGFVHCFDTSNIYINRQLFRVYVTLDNAQDVNTTFLEVKGKCFILPLQLGLHELAGNQSIQHPEAKGPVCLKGTKK